MFLGLRRFLSVSLKASMANKTRKMKTRLLFISSIQPLFNDVLISNFFQLFSNTFFAFEIFFLNFNQSGPFYRHRGTIAEYFVFFVTIFSW